MLSYIIFRDWKDKTDHLYYCHIGEGCNACKYLQKYENKLSSKFRSEDDKFVAYALHLSRIYTEEYLLSLIDKDVRNLEEEEGSEHNEEFRSIIESFWFVLYQETSNSNEHITLSVEVWTKLCIFLKKYVSKFIINAPLIDRAAKLTNYSNDLKKLSQLMKEKFQQYVHPCARFLTGHSHNAHKSHGSNSCQNNDNDNNNNKDGNGNNDEVNLVSAATRITQVASSGDVLSNAHIFGTSFITVMMLDLNLVDLPHSCAPSHSFKVSRKGTLPMLNKMKQNNNHINNNFVQNCSGSTSGREEGSCGDDKDKSEREFDNDIAYEMEIQVIPLFDGKTKLTSSAINGSNSSNSSNSSSSSSSSSSNTDIDDMITVSRIGLGSVANDSGDVNDVQSRRKRLNDLGFAGDCHCVRCSYERCDWDRFSFHNNFKGSDKGSEDGKYTVGKCMNRIWHGRDLLLLGYHYMREKNMTAANELFAWMFSTTNCNNNNYNNDNNDDNNNNNNNNDSSSSSKPQSSSLFDFSERAEAGHALGAVLLSEKRWTEALEIWKVAHDIDPKHPQLKEIFEKCSAYNFSTGKTIVNDTSTLKIIKYESILDDVIIKNKRKRTTIIPKANTNENECAIFRSSEAIQSKEACESVIQLVEDYASGNGWSQTRHYAVPTTDIAVHTHPKLLNWFKKLCQVSLYPLLAAQFPRDFDGKPENVYINDCFVVKYEACKDMTSSRSSDVPRNYLPLHVDEASHSVIIALNDPKDYQGGGTYFAASDSVVRLPQGQMLSFSGEVLHGGEALLEGKRYIMAIFLYLRNCEKDIRNSCEIAMKNKEEVVEDKKEQKKFSFGFNI